MAQPLIGPPASASRASASKPPDSGQMLRGALEIMGFLAQRASLEPPGLLGQHLQHLSPLPPPPPAAVFISIMSFAYYRQSAVSYHVPVVPLHFLLPILPSALETVGDRDPGGSILNRFL